MAGARLNFITPRIIMPPLARDELGGPRGEGYRRMIDASAASCAGTLDEVGGANTLPTGPDGDLITGAKIGRDEWLSQTRAYRCHYTTLAE